MYYLLMGRGNRNSSKGNAIASPNRSSLKDPVGAVLKQSETLSGDIKGEFYHWSEASAVGNSPAINQAREQYGNIFRISEDIHGHLENLDELESDSTKEGDPIFELRMAREKAERIRALKSYIELEGSPEPEIDNTLKSLIENLKTHEARLNA